MSRRPTKGHQARAAAPKRDGAARHATRSSSSSGRRRPRSASARSRAPSASRGAAAHRLQAPARRHGRGRHARRQPQEPAQEGRAAAGHRARGRPAATTTAISSPSRPCGSRRGERPDSAACRRASARGPQADIEAEIGVGDRVLARITELDEPDVDGYRFEASPIKRLPREKRRLIGIFRAHPQRRRHASSPSTASSCAPGRSQKGDEGARQGRRPRALRSRQARAASTCRRRACWNRSAIPTTSARSASSPCTRTASPTTFPKA